MSSLLLVNCDTCLSPAVTSRVIYDVKNVSIIATVARVMQWQSHIAGEQCLFYQL